MGDSSRKCQQPELLRNSASTPILNTGRSRPMLRIGKPEHAALPTIWEKLHHGSPAQPSLRVTLARRHPLWGRKTEARSDTGGTLQGGASQPRSSRSSFWDQRSGFFLGGNSRYENAIALRTIHKRFSRATGSSTCRLNTGG
jgi:hypothetical protein